MTPVSGLLQAHVSNVYVTTGGKRASRALHAGAAGKTRRGGAKIVPHDAGALHTQGVLVDRDDFPVCVGLQIDLTHVAYVGRDDQRRGLWMRAHGKLSQLLA